MIKNITLHDKDWETEQLDPRLSAQELRDIVDCLEWPLEIIINTEKKAVIKILKSEDWELKGR